MTINTFVSTLQVDEIDGRLCDYPGPGELPGSHQNVCTVPRAYVAERILQRSAQREDGERSSRPSRASVEDSIGENSEALKLPLRLLRPTHNAKAIHKIDERR
jgi:hypothetical protein